MAMIKLMNACKTSCVLAMMLAVTACGLTAPRGEPGFANFESPGVWDTDREFAFSMGPTLLRFAARHIEDDPETVALLRSLDGVRIRVYEIDGDSSKVAIKMDRMKENLEVDGWQSVMLVQQENERTHLMLKSSGSEVHGMTLLTSDGESEAVVINLIGDIQPELFSDAMIALDINEGGAQDVEVKALAENEDKSSNNSPDAVSGVLTTSSM